MKIRNILGGSALLIGLAVYPLTVPAASAATLPPLDSDALTTAYQLIQFDLAECQAIALKPGVSANDRGIVAIDILETSGKICGDAEHYSPILEQLAQSHGFTLPSGLPYYLTARYAALVRHQGPNLGIRYLKDQISSHEDALAVFQDEAAVGTDPQIKATFTQVIPVVQGNLELLQQTLAKH